MQIKESKILSGYSLAIIYPEDNEYETLKPLFDVYGLAVADVNSNVVYVDGGAFDEQNLDNDHLDAIDAHEMSHIILNHGTKETTQEEELQADYFAILILNAIDYTDAAQILIDYFYNRHNIEYSDAEKVINPKIKEQMSSFIDDQITELKIIDESLNVTTEFFNLFVNENVRLGKKKLMEGRVDDAWKFAQEHNITEQLFSEIKTESAKLNPQHKYLMWILLQITQNNIYDEEKIQDKIIKPLQYFNSHAAQFSQRDINAYTTLEEFSKAVYEIKNKERREFNEINPGEKIYEDDSVQVFSPSTHESSCAYGAGTKWCTASSFQMSYFRDYKNLGELYYILSKTKPSGDDTYKLAIRFSFKYNESGYVIQEIRDAKNERNIDVETFLTYVGQNTFDYIVRDFNSKHEEQINAHSTLKLKEIYEKNPKSILETRNYHEIVGFLINIFKNVTRNLVIDELVKNGISPLSKYDFPAEKYLEWLIDNNRNDFSGAVTLFVDEYCEINNSVDTVAMRHDWFATDHVVVYYQTKYPKNWPEMVVEYALGRYELEGLGPIKSNLANYFPKINEQNKEFWNYFGGFGGFLSTISKTSQVYFYNIISNEKYKIDLITLLSSAIKTQNIIELYHDVNSVTDGKVNLFELVGGHNTIRGFEEIYGKENATKMVFEFFEEKNISPYGTLKLEMLINYFGSPENVISSAIQYFSEFSDQTKLMEFLSDNFSIEKLVSAIMSSEEKNELDSFKTILEIFGDVIFDYFEKEEILNGNFDINFLEEAFMSVGLIKTLQDELTTTQHFKLVIDKLNNNITSEEKIKLKKKAYDIADMSGTRFNADGTVDLLTDGYRDFVDLFHTGYRDIDYKTVAERLFSEDYEDFYSFYDVIGDWKNDVWDSSAIETIKLVREYVTENVLPVDIYPEDFNLSGDYVVNEDGYFELTSELLPSISDEDLGLIIENHDGFEDVKNETSWAYSEGYRGALYDMWFEEYTDEIFGALMCGNPRWEKTGIKKTHRYKSQTGEIKEYESDEEVFVFPNISFFDILLDWIHNNNEYYDEFQYGFIDTLADLLDSTDSKFKPRTYDYPNNNKVYELYNLYIKDRI